MSDKELLQVCQTETFRGSGRGGQKRNVTDSAVRVTYDGSGISGESDETRSQHKNRSLALRALRRAIALKWRDPLPENFTGLPPKPSVKNPSYPSWLALVMDLLAECDWQVGTAARRAGTSTGKLVKDLASDRQLWRKVNQHRQKHGQKPLRTP